MKKEDIINVIPEIIGTVAKNLFCMKDENGYLDRSDCSEEIPEIVFLRNPIETGH